MLEFTISQIVFYLSLCLVLFVPGYFFLLALTGKTKLSSLERFTVSFGLSILITNFIMLFLSRLEIPFTKTALLSSFSIFSFTCLIIFILRLKRFAKNNPEDDPKKTIFNFSSKQTILICIILFLSVFLRSAYLQNSIPPSSTDLGHHMYWSKLFAETGKISNYTQRDIIERNDHYQIDTPRPISDFIIGEHLIFSAINILSGVSFFSGFPVLVLFLINLFTLLAIFVLALRLFQEQSYGKNIAIFSLLFSGALFAIIPPQAKFVGGGVIGNIMGNLILPIAFYFYLRFLREKETIFLFLALFFSMGLFYTHHLTGLVFLLITITFGFLSIIFNSAETRKFIWQEKKQLLSPSIVAFIFFAVTFIFFVYMPTYLKNSAVNTVVGETKKVEHAGLALPQFRNIIGEARIALGFFGLCLLILSYKKAKFKYSILFVSSWIIIITIISLAPQLLKVSIPSSRIANYGIYPLAILSAFALSILFQNKKDNEIKFSYAGEKMITTALVLLFTFTFLNGLENTTSLINAPNNGEKAEQTFAVSKYLSSKLEVNDTLASDHVYIFADSWTKLFFMRDYNFPVYRANFERYENGIDKKEFCSRDMLSAPDSALGQKCYTDLSTNFVIVDKDTDSGQFQKLENFSQIYSNTKINAYYRK